MALQHCEADQSEDDQEGQGGQDPALQCGHREWHGGRGSEAETLRAGKEPVQGLTVRDSSPGLVGGDAHEKLFARPGEPVLEGDPQQGEGRIRVTVGEGVSVVKVPEPDLLALSPRFEHAVFRWEELPAANL